MTSISIDDDRVSYREGWTNVKIEIGDDTGRKIGHAGFAISPDGKTVHHSEMVLEPGVQGQGFATRQMVHVVDAYRSAGVRKMTLTANADVGGYAWARAGFSFDDSQIFSSMYRESIVKKARNAARRADPATRLEIRRVTSDPRSSPIDFAMIGHTPGATMWPGKKIMLGSTWNATMELTP